MPGVRQTSFSGGELDPRFHGRTDLKIYEAGAARLENFIPTPYGSVVSRPGTYFINRTKTDQEVRLIPFNYSDDGSQNYVLEFGNLYVRFHQVAGTVESSPGVPYEVVTPYVTADLPKLKYVQVGDVLTIVHGSYAPRELTRAAHTSWALTAAVFDPGLAVPGGVIVDTATEFYPAIDATHPGKPWKWVATAVYADGTESGASPFGEPPNTTDASSGMIACYTDRPVYLTALRPEGAVKLRFYKGRNGIFCGAAVQLKDGRIVIGKNSEQMHAAASMVLTSINRQRLTNLRACSAEIANVTCWRISKAPVSGIE